MNAFYYSGEFSRTTLPNDLAERPGRTIGPPWLKDVLPEEISPKLLSSLKKWMNEADITRWRDFDKWHLSRFVNKMKRSGVLAPSSIHTLCAALKAFIGRHEDELENLPNDWRKVLSVRNETPMKTYLTPEEVEDFGNAYVESDAERTVRDGFYVSCKTGLRHSDLVKLLPSAFQQRPEGGYFLNYVSKKTHVQSTVICSEKTKQKVEWLAERGVSMSIMYYNKMVRVLAERADINTEVSVFKAGKELSGPKWMFLSSHSARVSFCTILADLGMDILDIMRMAGHSNISMTTRYVARHEIKINEKAMEFLM